MEGPTQNKNKSDQEGPNPRSPEEGPNLEKEGEKEGPTPEKEGPGQPPKGQLAEGNAGRTPREGRAKTQKEVPVPVKERPTSEKEVPTCENKGTTPLTFSEVKKQRKL